MKRISTVLGLVLAFAVGAPAFAATSVIVNITGNNNSDPCNSTLIGKTSGFEITSYSLGGSDPVSNVGTGSGASAGKISLSDLVIAKPFSSCSGEITKDFLTGKRLATVTLYDYKQSGTGGPGYDFLTITLSNVIITSYQLSDSASTIPQESISLTYSKVCISNTPQSATGAPNTAGATTVCYDKTANTIS
jgi:type VI secretion system secreted protein Hcp